jgi:prepilin-type N-terminal cleavage/methylation domain-containing protein
MKISKLIRQAKYDDPNAGFTLIELLLAIALTGIVSTIISSGISMMISSNQKLAAEQNRRLEVSRVLDTIVYDIQKAKNVNGTQNTTIVDGAKTATPAANIGAAITAAIEAADSPENRATITATSNVNIFEPTLDTLGTPVLFLEIPVICKRNDALGIEQTYGTERVIYSIKAKQSGEQRLGPNILYRFGRITDADGNVDCLPGSEAAFTPIADKITAPTTNVPSCSATADNLSIGSNGFYSCVSDTQVSISIYAELNNRRDSQTIIAGFNRTSTAGSDSTTFTTDTTAPAAAPSQLCKVPPLVSTSPLTTPSGAATAIGAAEIEPPPTSGATTAPLLYSGVNLKGGTEVISQTPLEGTTIPCGKGLVTYTY